MGINNQRFDILTAGIVLLNAVVIGVQADWSVKHPGDTLPAVMEYCNLFFTAAFTVELLLRIVADGLRFASVYSRDFQVHMFDTLLVLSAIMETLFWLIGTSIVDISAARLLRLLRLVRILRVVR